MDYFRQKKLKHGRHVLWVWGLKLYHDTWKTDFILTLAFQPLKSWTALVHNDWNAFRKIKSVFHAPDGIILFYGTFRVIIEWLVNWRPPFFLQINYDLQVYKRTKLEFVLRRQNRLQIIG